MKLQEHPKLIIPAGFLAGLLGGIIARAWMRWISTDPEFSWAGSLGIVFGFVLGAVFLKKDPPKTAWSFLVWGIYTAILLARSMQKVRGRKVALVSVASFLFVMLTFPIINMVSSQH